MSSRPQFDPFPVINAKSMATNLTSDVTIIQKLSMISYSYAWSNGSTPIGAISIEISNDYSKNPDGTVRNSGTWTPIYFQLDGAASLVNSIPISGNSGNGFVDVPITSAYAIRTVYTRTSGSGTLTVVVNGKVA
jgi:hypothetical protein